MGWAREYKPKNFRRHCKPLDLTLPTSITTSNTPISNTSTKGASQEAIYQGPSRHTRNISDLTPKREDQLPDWEPEPELPEVTAAQYFRYKQYEAYVQCKVHINKFLRYEAYCRAKLVEFIPSQVIITSVITTSVTTISATILQSNSPSANDIQGIRRSHQDKKAYILSLYKCPTSPKLQALVPLPPNHLLP